MNKLLILLAALTFCCCITTLHGCRCRTVVKTRIPAYIVKKIEVTPVSGRCRYVEVLIFTWRGSKFCIDPTAKWFPEFIQTLQQKKANVTDSNPTTQATSTSYMVTSD
ncbi:C-X-C motif chemokine 13 [Mugil cephalus]|uniref:C-X-C motif chemokine 13 n=1 Tax=Mugil cephalus TaxID=48193 RepID=UPI001FB7F5F3|nr:C-X-C motif chemokine 13 [Mugil cephalus]XP_047448273.1 C-X-C motif chemokine 13 [Mugil cephalus]XP_047448274.1 C-X-C motif chemokine 13 [Mugil cephalus]